MEAHTFLGLFDIPLPWDVLNAATLEYLPEATLETPALGNSVFTPHHHNLGELGQIKLRKLGDKLTRVDVDIPQLPHLNERYQQCKESLQSILCLYWYRLIHDVYLWKAYDAYPPLDILALIGLKSVEDGYQTSQYFGDFIKTAFSNAQAVSDDAGIQKTLGRLSSEEAANLELRKKAKELGIRPDRLERWDRLIEYKKNGLTLEMMAERFGKHPRTIALDFQEMREKGLLP